MRRLLLLVLLVVFVLTTSGCGLIMAGLIRWDQRRWKAQQEALLEKETDANGTDVGNNVEADGTETVREVPESSEGNSEEAAMPVPELVVEECK